MGPGVLRRLQADQFEHDKKSHSDILCLPVGDRVRHMVLHFAKYVGRLAVEPSLDKANLNRTLVDIFIISLSSANALNVNLAEGANAHGRASKPVTGDVRDFFLRFAVITGGMAKACEALDHVEAFNSRLELERGVREACWLCIQAAKSLKLDLATATKAKWKAIDKGRRLTY
jgi:hypothetical protein